MWWYFEPGAEKMTGLAVRTDDAILVLNPDLKLVKQFPIPADLRSKDFAWSQTNVGTAVAWTTRTDRLRWGAGPKYEVYWLDDAGKITRHEEIALGRQGPDRLAYFMGIIVPAPLPLSVVEGVLWPLVLFSQGTTNTWSVAWSFTLEDYRFSLPLACLVSAVLAFLCYRRQARYGASRSQRVLWPLFVFAFGLPGWVGYRFGRTWPSLARCPMCHAAVPCDRIACAACQAEFPQPTMKGTEVLA